MLLGKKIIQIPVLLLLVFTISSCSKFNRLLKSNDNDKKYEAALKYYGKKDYHRAGQLFDDLLQTTRGTLRAEEVYYYYAYCKYHMAEIPSAGFHFKNFYETYPNSKFAEEAFYMFAYCSFIEAYPYNLDPTYTYQAIENIQMFVNVYPQSTYVEKCNQLIDECRLRLQTKAYKAAKLYYKIEEYNAAVVSFKNLVNDFPDLKEEWREEALFLIIKSGYMYADESIVDKQEVRYKTVVKDYQVLRDDYPGSKYMEEADELKKKALRKIEILTEKKAEK